MTEITMTDREIVDAALALANKFYSMLGYEIRDGFKFYESLHPQEIMVWGMACAAFNDIRGSDVANALEELEGEQ